MSQPMLPGCALQLWMPVGSPVLASRTTVHCTSWLPRARQRTLLCSITYLRLALRSRAQRKTTGSAAKIRIASVIQCA